MRIGDTAGEVRRYLDDRPYRYSFYGFPYSKWERAHFGTLCPECGALSYLCYAETGLFRSGPHLSRTLAAFFADDDLELFTDDSAADD